MRKLLAVLAAALLVGSGASQVYYDVEADSGSATVNSSVRLDCGDNCPVSRWTVRLNVPERAEIGEIYSQNGEVTGSETNGERLEVTTSTAPTRSEKITVSYRVTDDSYSMARGLTTRSISLPGFTGQQNSGKITVEDMVSGRIGQGFSYSVDGETLNFSGSGPTNYRAVSGDGDSTEHFEFFGPEIKNSSMAYRVSAGTTGRQNRYQRFPVVVMDSERYSSRLNEWSAGQYVNATIILRDDLEDESAPILAHEAIHGINQQHLDLGSDSSWFDEGIARYTEYLTRKSLGMRTRNVFGDDTTYTELKDGRRYRYTLYSKGKREQLWEYYQNDMEWMKEWKPEDGRRDFGYSYGELILRHYVANNGSVRSLYDSLEERDFSDTDDKWSYLSRFMDLTPCKHDSREEFESCLDRVNEFEHPVYVSTGSAEQRSLDVQEIEVEKPDPSPSTKAYELRRSGWSALQDLLKRIGELLEDII